MLALQASCLQFYRQFLESPNFASWFERRRGRVSLWQEAAWQQSRQEKGGFPDSGDVSDVRLVELFAELESELNSAIALTKTAAENPQVCTPFRLALFVLPKHLSDSN